MGKNSLVLLLSILLLTPSSGGVICRNNLRCEECQKSGCIVIVEFDGWIQCTSEDRVDQYEVMKVIEDCSSDSFDTTTEKLTTEFMEDSGLFTNATEITFKSSEEHILDDDGQRREKTSTAFPETTGISFATQTPEIKYEDSELKENQHTIIVPECVGDEELTTTTVGTTKKCASGFSCAPLVGIPENWLQHERIKNFTCPEMKKESKWERLLRSLCRSFDIINRYKSTGVDIDTLLDWNEFSLVKGMNNTCAYLQWRRTSCM